MNKETLEEKLDKKLGRPKLLKVKTAGSDFKGYPTPSDNDPDSQTNFAINIIATDDSTLIKQATPLDGGNLKWIMANMAVGGALSGAEDGKEGDSAGEKAINAGIGVAGGAFSQTPLGAYLTRKAKKESMSPAKGISILAHESPLFLRTTFKGGTAEKHEYIYIQTPKLHIGDPKGTKNKEVNITSDNTNITSDNINLISGKITSKCEQFSVTSATDPTSGNSEEKGKLDLDKDTCALSFQKAVTQWGKECVGIASNDRISLSTVTADPEASKVLSDAKGIDKGIQLKGKDADKIKLLLGDQQVSLQKNFVQIGHNDAYTKYTNSGRITSKCTGFTVQSDKVTLGQKAQTINMGGSSSTVNIKGKTFLG